MFFFFFNYNPFLFFKFKKVFIYLFYFWLHWVFVAAHELSLVAASGGYSSCGARASHCGGFSCGARALGTWALVVVTWGLQLLWLVGSRAQAQ